MAAATTEGKLLLFPVNELPELGRGKGVQTIKIHKTISIVLPPSPLSCTNQAAFGFTGSIFVTL